MVTGVSPNFPYAGKGTFDIHFTARFGSDPLPMDDKVLIRKKAAARRGLAFDTPETFIVYGDIAKGSFRLASHDGEPMGLVPAIEQNMVDPPIHCQRLQQAAAFATNHLDATKKSEFGPAFNCNNQGLLTCRYPVAWDDNASLFIPDKPPVDNVFDVFFAFKQTVPGLSTIKSHGGAGFDLSYVDLAHVDLSGVDLTGANLQNANLTGAKLIGAKLGGVVLSDAILIGADLTHATLDRANLQHANLTGAKLIGAKLGGVVLSDAILIGADLTHATLDGADLSGAKLEGATLSTDLTKAIIKAPLIFSTDPNHLTSFKNAKLNYSLIGLNWSCLDLTGASVVGMPADLTNLKAAHMTALGIDLSGKKLVNAVFTNATLTDSILTGAILDGADIGGAKLGGATLSTDLTKVICSAPAAFSTDPNHLTSFKDAKLNYALIGLNWSYLELTGAFIVGMPADLTKLRATYMTALGIDLSGKKLIDADFSYSRLANAKFNGAFLTGAVLTGADLTGAKLLSLTRLGGAHLDMANLSGADLTGAQLMETKGVSASLTYTFLTKAVFDEANLEGVDFSGATLIETSMKNTNSLERATFSGAYLNSVHFEGHAPNLQGAKFKDTCLIGCDLAQANMGPSGGVVATLEGAFLQAANFSNVILTGANLAGAIVSFGKGQIDTYYCDENHTKTAEPRRMRWPSATRVEESIKAGNCTCPNGNTYNNNVQQQLTFKEMCQVSERPPPWTPSRCKP
jgi:uncharacterized protein YjbI with pentapeptide repeats